MLTGKQEKFAQLVAQGKTQLDAYKEAYDAEKMSYDASRVEASRLAQDPNISLAIANYKKEYSQHLKYDAEAHFKELEELRLLALTPMGKDGGIDIKAAIKAGELKGKLCGLYIDRKQIDGTFTVDDFLKSNV